MLPIDELLYYYYTGTYGDYHKHCTYLSSIYYIMAEAFDIVELYILVRDSRFWYRMLNNLASSVHNCKLYLKRVQKEHLLYAFCVYVSCNYFEHQCFSIISKCRFLRIICSLSRKLFLKLHLSSHNKATTFQIL